MVVGSAVPDPLLYPSYPTITREARMSASFRTPPQGVGMPGREGLAESMPPGVDKKVCVVKDIWVKKLNKKS